MINWKNTAENLALILIGVIVGVIIGHKVTKVTGESLINELKPTINKAIDKETIANTINNAIDLKIDKIKKSDTLEININQTPDNNQDPVNIITQEPCDSIWGKLSDSRIKRLERWLKD